MPFTHIGPNFEHREESDTRWGRRIKTRTEEILAAFPIPTPEQRIQADREARADVLRDDLVDSDGDPARDVYERNTGREGQTDIPMRK